MCVFSANFLSHGIHSALSGLADSGACDEAPLSQPDVLLGCGQERASGRRRGQGGIGHGCPSQCLMQ